MDQVVFAESDQGLEGFVAHCALKGSGGVVGEQVVVQVAFLYEAFAALMASVFFDAQVDAFVSH